MGENTTKVAVLIHPCLRISTVFGTGALRLCMTCDHVLSSDSFLSGPKSHDHVRAKAKKVRCFRGRKSGVLLYPAHVSLAYRWIV